MVLILFLVSQIMSSLTQRSIFHLGMLFDLWKAVLTSGTWELVVSARLMVTHYLCSARQSLVYLELVHKASAIRFKILVEVDMDI